MPKRKLLRKQVEEIFKLYHEDLMDEFKLARRFDVAPETIRDIINRRTWRELDLKSPQELKDDRILTARAYLAMLDDGHSIFEVAMMNNVTPHEVDEEVKWYEGL